MRGRRWTGSSCRRGDRPGRRAPLGRPGWARPASPRLELLDSGLFRELREMALPYDDLLIAGSAPLCLHGLRAHIGDLDVVARGEAFARACALGEPRRAAFDDVLTVSLLGGRLEITNAWFPDLLGTPEELFARAERVRGLRFLTLADTARWKGHLDRPKDRSDLRRLARALEGPGEY
ncbi:hypothetical protein ACFCX4_01350 [Kitasatospora sp. NPDC056327]|uniref:hypothetical protein n=1 Tax=Kitasatospora sp. NPDC056327 TaxID=3345785 RepID=UPI0035DE6E6B